MLPLVSSIVLPETEVECNMKKHKNLIMISVAFLFAIGLGYLYKSPTSASEIKTAYEAIDSSSAIFPQEVVTVNDKPVVITKLYREQKLVGVLKDSTRLQKMFDEVYENEYKEEFPDSKLGFIDDLIQVDEMSFNVYEDRDNDIFDYLYKENLFAIEANKVTFSNGAIIYVKNSEDFDSARDKFIQNFTSESTFDAIKNNKKIPAITDYGTKDIDVKVKETVKVTRGLATKDKILKNETEILTFLSYGYNPKVETYKIKPFDTLEGIAYHSGMNVNQIQSINADKIKDVNQVLEVGSELRVSKFDSPFTVTVTKQRMTTEPVYPEKTVYQSDPELAEGKEVVDIVEQNGARDVIYEDVYENGASISTKEISSKETKKPVRGVIRYGTKVEPKVGSGAWRWPLDNAYVLCGYGCYPNHSGTDFSTHGSGYGPIYAIDRGVVTTNSYDPGGWGNYIVIDHGNGYRSLYAHMASPGYFQAGQTVAKGENIGYVGMTGRTSYPHVHLEIIVGGGTRVDACGVIGC